jgi:hypothetical protein
MRKKAVLTFIIFFIIVISVWSVRGYGSVYYVAQRDVNSSDTNPGTEAKPFKTISKAAEVARAGDTVIIKPGLYREALIPRHSGEKGKPITFRGEPMAQESPNHAIISGSEIISGFKKEGKGIWVKKPWRSRLYYDKKIMDGISADKYKASARMEEVFVDGKPLRWVPDRKHLEREPNSFLWTKEELAIRPPGKIKDLPKHLVEVPVSKGTGAGVVLGAWRWDDYNGWNDANEWRSRWGHKVFKDIQYIRIIGLQFTQATQTLNRGGVALAGDHWLLQDSIIDWMNANGVVIGANHDIIRDNIISHNGQAAIGGGRFQDALIEGNTMTFNNRKEYSNDWGGSGNKVTITKNVIFRDNNICWNKGDAIWFDIHAEGSVMEGNVAVGNYIRGGGGTYFYEISREADIRNNIAFGNNSSQREGAYGAGIVLSGSSDVTVEGNIIIGSIGGVSILGGPFRDERSGSLAEWPGGMGINNLIKGNIFFNNQTYVAMFANNSEVKPKALSSNDKVRDNSIIYKAGRSPFLFGTPDYKNASGNRFFKDWKELNPELMAKLNRAFGKIIKAIQPSAFNKLDIGSVKLKKVFYLGDNNQSVGYFLKAGAEYVLLIDQFRKRSYVISYLDAAPEGEISICSGVIRKSGPLQRLEKSKVKVRDKTVEIDLPKGIHLIRGLPAEIGVRRAHLLWNFLLRGY